MNPDTISTKEHIQAKITELINACQLDNTGTTDQTAKIRNLSQSILQDEVRLLDRILYDIYERYGCVGLSDCYKEKYGRHVYFPHARDENTLNIELAKAGPLMGKFKDTQPDIYKVLERYQPYNSGQDWNGLLHELSNLGHRKLIPQNKFTTIQTIIGTFPLTGSIKISNVVVSSPAGTGFIHNLEINKGVVKGFDPYSMSYQTQYLIAGTSIDIIALCIHSYNKIENIFSELSRY